MNAPILAITAALLLGIPANPALAQDQSDQPNAPRLREALQQRLDRIRTQESRLEEAITKLDAGADPRQLREQFAPEPDARNPRRDQSLQQDPPSRPTREELLAVLRDLDPDMANRIEAALDRNPQRAREQFRRMQKRLRDLAVLRKKDPAAYAVRISMQRAEREVLQAARRLHRAMVDDDTPDEALEQHKAALRDAISKRLDAEISLREHNLENFATRLESMRTQLDTLRQNKEQNITKHMEKVLDRVANAKPAGPDQDRRPHRPRR
jgi:hypothetical protein